MFARLPPLPSVDAHSPGTCRIFPSQRTLYGGVGAAHDVHDAGVARAVYSGADTGIMADLTCRSHNQIWNDFRVLRPYKPVLRL